MSNDISPSTRGTPWHTLHRTLGNQGVQRALRTRAIQAKLRVNQPNDLYEQEADRVADQVLTESLRPDVSRTPPRIQRYAGQSTGHVEPAPASVDHVLAGSGTPLEPTLRQHMEERFGHDFSSVRVHSGAAAEQSARDVNANAYTVGQNVVFGTGRFAPGTLEGLRLIAHELTHVVQQSCISSPRTIHRQRANYHAGGCATCRSASAAGSLAHPYVQGLFVSAYGQEIVSEAPVNNPHDENGRLDLFRIDKSRKPWIVEFGEIKPDNDKGVAQGRDDLDWYEQQLIRILEPPDYLVSRLDADAPSGTVPFKDNERPTCPSQVLSVRKARIGGPRGLYLYRCDPPGRPPGPQLPPCCHEREEEEPEPHDPPVMVEPLVEPPGDPQSTSESQGKGNGQPGKGNGEPKPGRPSRRPPGPGRPQPTFRLPNGIDADAFIAALTTLLALLALTPWGRLAELIGTPLGLFLRSLGFSLGILGGTVAAAPSAGSLTDPGGPSSGPPAGPPVPGTAPPAGTTAPPKGAPVPLPPAATRPAPGRPTVPHGQRRPAAAGAPSLRAPAQVRTIKMKLIEGLNLETVAVGTNYWLVNYRTHDIVLMQAMEKISKGKDTTVVFRSVTECTREGCSSGGNVYIVTHPYRGEPDAPVFRHAGSLP